MSDIQDFFAWATQQRGAITTKGGAGSGRYPKGSGEGGEYSIHPQGSEVKVGAHTFETGKVYNINDADRKMMSKKKKVYSMPEAIAASSDGSVKDGKKRYITVVMTSQSNGGAPSVSFDPPSGGNFYLVDGARAQSYSEVYK